MSDAFEQWHLGEWIDDYLAKHHRPASWLAQQVGRDPATIARWRSGESNPQQIADVLRLAEVLELETPDERGAFFRTVIGSSTWLEVPFVETRTDRQARETPTPISPRRTDPRPESGAGQRLEAGPYPGSIRIGTIESAGSVTVGTNIIGAMPPQEPLASDAHFSGEIAIESIVNSADVTVGVRLTHLAHPLPQDDLRRAIAWLRYDLERTLLSAPIPLRATSADAVRNLTLAEQELQKPQPNSHHVVPPLRSAFEALSILGKAGQSLPGDPEVSRFAAFAATLTQWAVTYFSE